MYIYIQTYEQLEKHYNYELTDDEWVETTTDNCLSTVGLQNNNIHQSSNQLKLPSSSFQTICITHQKIGTQLLNMDKHGN